MNTELKRIKTQPNNGCKSKKQNKTEFWKWEGKQ